MVAVHNFTAHPGVFRGFAERLAGEGFSVEMPLLSGHGREPEDIIPYRFNDFLEDASRALRRIESRTERCYVLGAGAGGTCALGLASREQQIAGAILISTPTGPLDATLVAAVEALRRKGFELTPDSGSVGSPNREETTTVPRRMPVRSYLSIHEAASRIDLASVRCPILGFYATCDRTLVDPLAHAKHLLTAAGGPVEVVTLRESGHFATVGRDAERIENRAVEFIRSATPVAGASSRGAEDR